MLAYRIAVTRDWPEIERLWEQAEWGGLTTEMRERWYRHPRRGESTVCLACDESGEVVGQLAFVPEYVSVRGRIVPAHRGAVPIVARNFRSRALRDAADHPVIQMYRHGVQTLRARGEAIVYTLPDPRWALHFRGFPPTRFGSFPFWSLALPLERRFALPEGYSAGAIDDDDPAIDELSARACQLHDCMALRGSGTLKRKLMPQGALLGIRGGDKLAAVVACAPRGNDWEICDVLSEDLGPSLEAALAAACNAGHERNAWAHSDGKSYEILKAGLLVTPALERAARALGFRRDRWDFHLLVQALDPSIDPEDVAPARWYCSQND